MTPWASDRISTAPIVSLSSSLSEMSYKSGYTQFKVGIEVRLWPAERSEDLHDVRIDGVACGKDVFTTCLNAYLAETAPLSSLAPGQVAWSHTAFPPDGGPMSAVQIGMTLE
jgi:hypothetical protein